MNLSADPGMPGMQPWNAWYVGNECIFHSLVNLISSTMGASVVWASLKFRLHSRVEHYFVSHVNT